MIRLLAASDWTQWAVFAAGALFIIYAVMRGSFKKKKDPLDKSAPKIGLSQQRSVERDMSNLLVELSEMSRQITAQLDTRSAKLEALMEDADKKIAELKRLSSSNGSRTESRSEGVNPHPITGPVHSSPAAIDARHNEIYKLADAGRSAQEIAHHLNRPRGEIELILALRQPAAS
jgi:hypothetical protein